MLVVNFEFSCSCTCSGVRKGIERQLICDNCLQDGHVGVVLNPIAEKFMPPNRALTTTSGWDAWIDDSGVMRISLQWSKHIFYTNCRQPNLVKTLAKACHSIGV